MLATVASESISSLPLLSSPKKKTHQQKNQRKEEAEERWTAECFIEVRADRANARLRLTLTRRLVHHGLAQIQTE